MRYTRSEGLLVEALDKGWAAYSPATGETLLLNDESACILELLEAGAEPSDTSAICAALAVDSELDEDALGKVVEAAWPRLIEAGLVREWPVRDVGAK